MSPSTVHVSAAFDANKPTRRASRHDVDLPCELISAAHDEPSLSWATDMSAAGLWLHTEQMLELGSEVVLCVAPGVFWRAREITVFGRVARISRGLRGDDDAPGMGIDFLDLTSAERWNLRRWLRPRPQPAARRRGFGRPRARTSHPFASRVC